MKTGCKFLLVSCFVLSKEVKFLSPVRFRGAVPDLFLVPSAVRSQHSHHTITFVDTVR